MKRIHVLFAMMVLLASSSFAQVTLDNFEETRKVWFNFSNGTLTPYFANPDMTGNTSPVIARYTRNAAEQFDVIVIDGDTVFEDMSAFLDGTKQMSLDVWSPLAGVTVQITVEDTNTAKPANFPNGRHSVYLATTTQDSAWETLTFTFNNRPDMSVPDNTVNRMVLLFNPDSNTDDTYFFDNLVGPAFNPDPCDGVMLSDSILNDFECNQSAISTFNHGASLRRIPNPDPSGANTTSYVASYTRNPGEEFDVIVGTFTNVPTLSDTSEFKLWVWSAAADQEVRLALQNDGNDVAAVSATTTTTSAWEELSFGYGDLSASNVNGYVLLFAPGTFTSETYFFDHLRFLTGESQIVGIEDFLVEGAFNVYPNPSQGMTRFSYELSQPAQVELRVYDLAGREVAVMPQGQQMNGSHEIVWDASEALTNGMYMYRLFINDQVTSGKLMLTK
ncbi:MAG: T9SS type A sorting domain-containing protein [Bacteroidota bacterium]